LFIKKFLVYIEKINVKYFSLLNDLKKKSSEIDKPLYYPRNTHWSYYGNEVLSEIIFNYLLKNSDDINDLSK